MGRWLALPVFEPDAVLERIAGARWVLLAIVTLSLALRLAHLAWLYDSPFVTSLVLDARAYDEWAQRIAAGAWIGREAFWVDPLYAYVLAAIYRVAGHDLLLPRLANVAFGIATAVVAADIARRVWSSRLAAALAAFFVAISIPAIHFEGQVEKTALSVLLLAVGVDLFLLGSSRAILAAGAIAGLATLARGNMALLVPLGALALACGWDRERSDTLAATRTRRVRRAALWLVGALPLIGLATLHNYRASGELVPTTTSLGINLYLGNHAANPYGYYEPPPFLHPDTRSEVPDFRAEAEKRTGQALSDRALSDYWTLQTWEEMKADPGLAAVRVVGKLRLALNDDEVPDSDDVALVAHWSPVLRSPVLWFGQVLPLALLGVVVGWRRRRVRVVAAVAATYLVTLLPFFIMARLRAPLLPLFAVVGSGAVVWIGAAFRARRSRELLLAAVVVAAGILVAFPRPKWMVERRTSSLAIGWHNLGAMLERAARTEEAIAAYERAVEVDARAVPAALRVLGRTYQERGDYQRAEEVMRKVVELRPDSRSAREALRRLYDAMLADPRWRDDPAIHGRRRALAAPKPDAGRGAIARVRALQSEGRMEEAIALLQQTVREGPYDENLHYVLGQMMERDATPEAMVEFFSEHVHHDQKPQTSHYYWAVGLARAGDAEAAVAQLRRALEIDPAHEMSQWKWGLLLEGQGRFEEALQHLVEATRIHPEYQTALRDAARVAERLGRSQEAEEYRTRAASADHGSIRRFLYWARYLHEHDRNREAWAEVHRFLAARPNDAEGLALRDEIRASFGGAEPPAVETEAPPSGLSPDARAQLVSLLRNHPRGTPAWISHDARDAGARDMARELAAAFDEAGWSVRAGEIGFPMRPGIFLMIADADPSEAAAAVQAALKAAQLDALQATGYRAYAAERRRADPAWQGFELGPDQEFVLAIGRMPAPSSD